MNTVEAVDPRDTDTRTRRWLFRYAKLVLVVLVCQSCRPSGAEVLHPTPENVPADASLIVNDTLPRGLSGRALQRWRDARDNLLAASPRLRIGSDQEGPELFGRVRDVSIDDAGNILVLDDQASEVRVFASDGRHLQTFGGHGDGPSEMRGATAIQSLPGGRLLVLGRPRRGKLFERTPTGYRIIRPLEVMVDAPDAACSNDAVHAFVAGGTGAQRSAVHKVNVETGELVNHVGIGYVFDDWAVRGMIATGTVGCLGGAATRRAVFHASEFLPFVRAYRASDGLLLWVARLDGFMQTRLVTPRDGGIIVWGDHVRDRVSSIQPISPAHLIVQTSRFAPSERDPSSVSTYLVDVETGSGALISDELGDLVSVTTDRFVFLGNRPFPQLEVRDR